MPTSAIVRDARSRAGLTQRELARRTGVAQPTIARIESGLVDPRMHTIDRLLTACGESLVVAPRGGTGAGVDRGQLRELLRLTPRQRVDLLRDDVAGLRRFELAVRA